MSYKEALKPRTKAIQNWLAGVQVLNQASAIAATEMGTGMVILGSDDEDLEDDVSNEYHASLPRSESVVPSKSPEVGAYNTSGEQVNEAMQEAHAGLFEESPSVNITGQSAHIDLQVTPASTSVKRNFTTMEQVSKQTYSRKKGLFTRPSYSVHASKNEDTEPTKKRAKSTGVLPSESSPRKVSQSKRSDTTNFDMPSSHETHAAGSKQLLPDSPEMFRTQTTVPFNSATQAATQAAAEMATQVATQQISPMVLIPAMEHHGPAETKEPRSSAVLADIEGIEEFLKEDIAHGRAAEGQHELVDTDPPSLEHIEEELRQPAVAMTVDPQSLMLDHHNEELGVSFPKSSHDPIEMDAPEPSPVEPHLKSFKRKCSQMADVSDELDPDLPPPEMYQPRPSKSRGRRTTVDVSTLQRSGKSQEEPKRSTKVKRRKTAGDMQAPIEVLDEDEQEEAPRPAKRAKREGPQPQPDIEPPPTNADDDEEGGVAETRSVPRDIPLSTVDIDDMAEEAHEPPDMPATKKKRGRPTKADQQQKKDDERRAAAAPSTQHADSKRPAKTRDIDHAHDSEPDSEKVSMAIAIKVPARRKTSAARNPMPVSDDSEDELAGHSLARKPEPAPQVEGHESVEDDAAVKPTTSRGHNKATKTPGSAVENEDEPESADEPAKAPAKRGRKPTAKKNVPIPTASDSEHDPEHDSERDELEETPEPIKVPAKRGRKPKASKSADIVTAEEPDEPAAPPLEAEPEQEQEQERSPLKEKVGAENQETRPGQDSESVAKKLEGETSPRQVAAKAGGKVGYRVGLSRRMRIAPLLKVVKR